MKKLMSIAALLAGVAVTTSALADGPQLLRLNGASSLLRSRLVSLRQGGPIVPEPYPLSAGELPPGALVLDGPPVLMSEYECELFPCVKYKSVKKIAPCAVPMIVSVKDPCACDDVCSCGPKCVNVKICVPPCECADIKIKRCGDRVCYDFGKYEVVITSKKGIVVVNYNS